MWRKGNPCALLVGMQTGAATMENSVEIPQKTKNGPYDPPIPLLGIYPKKLKTNLKEYMHHCVHCSVIYNGQALESTQVPINK